MGTPRLGAGAPTRTPPHSAPQEVGQGTVRPARYGAAMLELLRKPEILVGLIALAGTALGAMVSSLTQTRTTRWESQAARGHMELQFGAERDRRLWEARRDVYARYLAAADARSEVLNRWLGRNAREEDAQSGFLPEDEPEDEQVNERSARLDELRWEVAVLAGNELRDELDCLSEILSRHEVRAIMKWIADPTELQLALAAVERSMRKELISGAGVVMGEFDDAPPIAKRWRRSKPRQVHGWPPSPERS